MTAPKLPTFLLPVLLLALALVATSCASGPRYGSSAKGKKRKDCDCPKWNALPPRTHQDVRVSTPPPATTPTTACRS